MKPASPKMGTLIAVYVVFSACLSLATAFTPSPPGNPYANLEGQPCDPPFGYTRRNCGSSVLLSSTSEPAPRYKYGPNVCRVVNTYQLNELEYTYRSSCGWVYSHYQYRWVQQCQLICRPTTTCLTDRNVTVTRANFECCEGFTTRPAPDDAYNKYYFNFYYNQVPQEPEGCRIAVADSLLECLEIQNLTSFISYLNQSTYLELLNTTGETLTVFAPTNAAFAAMSDQLIGMNPNTLVGNHIVNATILSTQLRSMMRFETVAQTTLHSTAVVFHDTSFLYTNPHYLNYYHQSNLVRTRSERFINGAQIVNDNACRTPDGTLHIVNRVLMPGTQTIAQILRNDPRFSNLTTILDAVGVLPFLNKSDISRTLFAPTDDVFGRQFPPELINCLTVYMRRPLNDIALFHIAQGAEYNTSLALRQWQYTLLLRYLRVHAFANGSIFLGTNLTEIVVPNIPAQNGVIHIINGVLLPPNFSFGMCQQFVPTPPPTTPPPTTPPPTTPPPTTPPVPSPPPPVPSPAMPPSSPSPAMPPSSPSLPSSPSPIPVLPTPMARPSTESGDDGGGVQGAIEDEEYYYYY